MQQNSTVQKVITSEQIEELVGSKHSQFFNNLSPLTLLLLKDESSEDNIKIKLAEALSKQNGKQPTQEEVDSLFISLKKVVAFIDQQKNLSE